jgi:hypothetical protein
MRTLEDSHLPALPQMELPLMSSVAASPAKTSALRARARDLRASAAAYGRKSPDFLASYAPATSSWKTSQRCLVEGWTGFSGTWPRSGMMRNGTAYRLPPLVRLTEETDSGLWQTLVADDAVARAAGKFNSRGEAKLSAQVKIWPTPTVTGNYNRKGMAKTSGDGLVTAVRQLCDVVGGQLNPTWAEWLMGFPLGWTDLEPSETPSSLKSRK